MVQPIKGKLQIFLVKQQQQQKLHNDFYFILNKKKNAAQIIIYCCPQPYVLLQLGARKKEYWWRALGALSGDLGFNFQHPRDSSHNYNYSFRGSDNFLPPWVLYTDGRDIYTGKTATHIKDNNVLNKLHYSNWICPVTWPGDHSLEKLISLKIS